MNKKIILGFTFVFCSFIIINSNVVKAISNESADISSGNVQIFNDIKSHWAKENIITLTQNNILNGYTDNTFRPNEKVTVAEFLKMIITAGKYTLVRVGENIWPDFYVATALENELISDMEFEDYDKSITRYEAIDIISKYIDLKGIKASKNKFKDLDEKHYDEVLKLVNLKILTGYTDKTFRGENNITRAEAATIIVKSLSQKKNIDLKKEIDITQRTDLSNYGADCNLNSNYFETRYEINGNELKIFDNGRYSNSSGYLVSGEQINAEKICKVIKKLINEEAYVSVLYMPSKYTLNQLKIAYGESATKLNYGEEDFSLTYYENKPYELGRISMNERFSNDCYLKIEIVKLWSDYSEYQKGNYLDEYKKQKLLNALKIEFGADADKILKYMIQKNELFASNEKRDEEHCEQRTFGKYKIDFYQKEYGVPQFYISKIYK